MQLETGVRAPLTAQQEQRLSVAFWTNTALSEFLLSKGKVAGGVPPGP